MGARRYHLGMRARGQCIEVMSMGKESLRRWSLLVAVVILWPGLGAAQNCGDLVADAAGYGPYDYRDPNARAEGKLHVVERRHFTREVELLEKGSTSTTPGPDLDYTLRHIPNHSRALASMARLFVRNQGQRPMGSNYSMDCWFRRARQFAPDDAAVPMVHAVYLAELGRTDEALKKLHEAMAMDPGNANVRYNLGLAYARRGELDKAVEHARAAYGAGFPLPGLRDLLASKGAWPPDQ